MKGIFVLIFALITISLGGCRNEEESLNKTPGFRTLAWEEGTKYHYNIIYKDKKIGEMSMQVLSNLPGARNDMVFESITEVTGAKKVTEIRRVFFDPMVSCPPKSSSSNIQVGEVRMQSEVSYSEGKAKIVMRNEAAKTKTDNSIDYEKGLLVIDNSSLPFLVRYWKGKKADVFIVLSEMNKGLKGQIIRNNTSKVKVKSGEFDATQIEVRVDDKSRHFFIENKKPYRLLKYTITTSDESEIRFELID